MFVWSWFSLCSRSIAYFDTRIISTRIVTVAARGKSPIPVVKPMAAVAHRLAAVVIPLTLSLSDQIVTAPMKPIPVTIAPAT